MREDATAGIGKALCKAFPNGPSTKNKTNSFPLHFAAKRKVPNLDILRILIRRNPTAAGAVNDFGLLPMHCITALSDNVQAVELIHCADESAVKVSYEPVHQRVLSLDCTLPILLSLEWTRPPPFAPLKC
jgi:hypothetical protein